MNEVDRHALTELLEAMQQDPAVSVQEHEAREQAYASMDRVLVPLARPAVLVMFEPESSAAHVVIEDPEATPGEIGPLLELGHKALLALTLYTRRLEAQLAEAADPARQT